jgi:hypothetical protein
VEDGKRFDFLNDTLSRDFSKNPVQHYLYTSDATDQRMLKHEYGDVYGFQTRLLALSSCDYVSYTVPRLHLVFHSVLSQTQIDHS